MKVLVLFLDFQGIASYNRQKEAQARAYQDVKDYQLLMHSVHVTLTFARYDILLFIHGEELLCFSRITSQLQIFFGDFLHVHTIKGHICEKKIVENNIIILYSLFRYGLYSLFVRVNVLAGCIDNVPIYLCHVQSYCKIRNQLRFYVCIVYEWNKLHKLPASTRQLINPVNTFTGN